MYQEQYAELGVAAGAGGERTGAGRGQNPRPGVAAQPPAGELLGQDAGHGGGDQKAGGDDSKDEKARWQSCQWHQWPLANTQQTNETRRNRSSYVPIAKMDFPGLLFYEILPTLNSVSSYQIVGAH